MIQFTAHISRPDAERMVGQPDWGIVSILSPPDKGEQKELADLHGWGEVRRFWFHDADRPAQGIVLFDNDQADEIIRFLRDYRDKLGSVYVHCEAGISRSAAVAWFITDIFDLPPLSGRSSLYNRYVYTTLMRQYMG